MREILRASASPNNKYISGGPTHRSGHFQNCAYFCRMSKLHFAVRDPRRLHSCVRHPNATQFNDYVSHMRQMHNAADLHMHEVTECIYIYAHVCTVMYALWTTRGQIRATSKQLRATKRRSCFETLERCNLSFIATAAARR